MPLFERLHRSRSLRAMRERLGVVNFIAPKEVSAGQFNLSASEVALTIGRGRFRQGDEYRLHEDLAEHLIKAGIAFKREVRLSPGNRIDFLCDGGLGIECKARARKREVFRQLERYAAEDAISALILVTGTALGLPADIAGKPLFYVPLGRTAL